MAFQQVYNNGDHGISESMRRERWTEVRDHTSDVNKTKRCLFTYVWVHIVYCSLTPTKLCTSFGRSRSDRLLEHGGYVREDGRKSSDREESLDSL